MAKRTTTVLVDDITGAELGKDAVSVTFALEGVQYEIDLAPSAAADLREAFEPYIAAGRRVGGRKRSTTSKSSGEQAEARAWLTARGIDVPSRGRIAADLMEQFRSR